MHKFLRAAGFADMNEAKVYSLLYKQVILPENITARLDIDEETVLYEYRRAVNENIGICTAVLYIGDNIKEIQYYYPYYNTYEFSTEYACTIERQTAGSTYAGIMDGYNMGLSVIFFMTEPVLYRQRPDADTDVEFRGTALSAFADSGIVILPVLRNETIEAAGSADGNNSLIEAAIGGDEEAIETLTASDMNMYQQISDRIESEDLYSVVDQSFMPCGVECDIYSVIGEILDVNENVNALTDEKLWQLKLNCNGVEFWLCIRQADLTGEPMKGRRIKCRLWMQGSVNMHV